MKMLLGAAGIQTASGATTTFTDVSMSWMVPYVAQAQSLGIVSGQTVDGQLVFRPNDSITRAEVAKVVVRTMDLKSQAASR